MSEKPLEALIRSALDNLRKDPEVVADYDAKTIEAVNDHTEEKRMTDFIRHVFGLITKGRVSDAVRALSSELYRSALIREENVLYRTKFRLITKQIEILEKQLSQAMTDDLTGLPSRRIFNAKFVSELARVRRYEGEVALLFCDIDHFKMINDTFGHEAGDEALKLVAQVFKKIFYRSTDHICRFGGEELVVCLVNCDPINAKKKADELRRAVSQIESSYGQITISIGCAHVNQDRLNQMRKYPEWEYLLKKCLKDFPMEPNMVLDMTAARLMFAEADGLVYKAKKNGRDRVELAQNEQELASLREIALQKRLGNGNGSGNGNGKT